MTERLSEAISTASSSITVFAPAKINLVLRILDRRPDGYHNLWSLMQTVGLEDEVAITTNQSHADIRLQCDSRALCPDQTNLVYRAAAAVLHRSGSQSGLEIVLRKRIPVGAGLGGGSSDAAATIKGLNQLLHLGWSVMEMAEVGQTLGSDVPFFFFAPSAVVAGRGEVVTSVRISGSRWVVLVNPGFPVETKWAYQQLVASRTAVQPLSASLVWLAEKGNLSWEQVLSAVENDFETPIFKSYPVIQEIKRNILAQGAEAVLLSGSGASVFGIFPDEGSARHAQTQVETNPGLKVFSVPVGSGPLRCQP